jgi:alpha-glucosidase
LSQAQRPLLYELESYDPVANLEAIVVSGKARFTVLTERLIRMEYDENAIFEDRATLAFVNRKLPVPDFTL